MATALVVRLVALQLMGSLYVMRLLWNPGPSLAAMEVEQAGTIHQASHSHGLHGANRQVPDITLVDLQPLLPEWCDEAFLFHAALVSLAILLLWPHGRIARAASGTFLMAYAAGVCQDVARCHPVAYTSCFVMAALCAQPDRDLVRRCATLAFGAMWAWAGFFKLNPKLTTESEFKGTVEVALFPLFSVVGDDMWMDHSERIIYGAAVGEMVCGLVLVADSFGLFPRRGLPHFAAGLVFAGHAVTLGSSLFLSGGFGLRADMRGALEDVIGACSSAWTYGPAVLAIALQPSSVAEPTAPARANVRLPRRSASSAAALATTIVFALMMPAANLIDQWPAYLSHAIGTGNYDRFRFASTIPMPTLLEKAYGKYKDCSLLPIQLPNGKSTSPFPQANSVGFELGCWYQQDVHVGDWHAAWAHRIWADQLCNLADSWHAGAAKQKKMWTQTEDGTWQTPIHHPATLEFFIVRKLAFPYTGHPMGDMFSCGAIQRKKGVKQAPGLDPPYESFLVALMLTVLGIFLQRVPGEAKGETGHKAKPTKNDKKKTN